MSGKEQENSFLKVKQQFASTPVVAYVNKEVRQPSCLRDCACKGS